MADPIEPALLDQYAHRESVVHRAPPGLKLAMLIAVVATVALFEPGAVLFGSVAVGLVAVAAASRVPARFLLRKLLLVEPFVLGVVAMTLFQADGIHRFVVTLTRSTLCLSASILVATTTPFTEFLGVLRAWRLPPILVATLALTYRYLFVLVDEALRMRRARAARTFTRTRRLRWESLASVAAHLFTRGVARAERIHSAMSARGWQP